MIGRVGRVGTPDGKPPSYAWNQLGKWRELTVGRDAIFLVNGSRIAKVARDATFMPTVLGAECADSLACVSSAACIDNRCVDLEAAAVAELTRSIDIIAAAPNQAALDKALTADAKARAEQRNAIAHAADLFFGRAEEGWAQAAASAEVSRFEALIKARPDLLTERMSQLIEYSISSAVMLPKPADPLAIIIELGESLIGAIEPHLAADDLIKRAQDLVSTHKPTIDALRPRLRTLDAEARKVPEVGLAISRRHELGITNLRARWRSLAAIHPIVYSARELRALDLVASVIAIDGPGLLLQPQVQDMHRPLSGLSASPETRRPADISMALETSLANGTARRREFYVMAKGDLVMETFPGDAPLPLPRVTTWESNDGPFTARIDFDGKPATWLGSDLKAVRGLPNKKLPGLQAIIRELTHPLPPAFRDGWTLESHPKGFTVEVPSATSVQTMNDGDVRHVTMIYGCELWYSVIDVPAGKAPKVFEALRAPENWSDSGATLARTMPGPRPAVLDIEVEAKGEVIAFRYVAHGDVLAVLGITNSPSCRFIREHFFGSHRVTKP